MLITPIDPLNLQEIHDAHSVDRSGGLHLSTIIQDLAYRGDYRDGAVDSSTRQLWEAGFIWEDMGGRTMAHRYHSAYPSSRFLLQCELQSDGVFMTPDILDVERGVDVEMKWTRRKYEGPGTLSSPRYRHWMWAAKAYCRAACMVVAEFHVLFVNGDYSRGAMADTSAQEPKAWRVEFSGRDLEDNWRMLMNHRALMKREGKL